MTERSRFWDGSTTGDAVSITDDEFVDRVFRALFSGTGNQGVLHNWLNELEVTDGGGLNAAVDTGGAILYGLFYENDTATTVACPNNSTVHVVVRRSWAAQTARLTQVAALVQNPGVTYDIPLAEVTTVAGAITLITDERDFCEFSTAMLDGAVLEDSIVADAVTTAKLENQTRWITRGVGSMIADATNPATLANYGVAYPYLYMPWRTYWSFSTGVTDTVWITFQAPADLSSATMAVYFWGIGPPALSSGGDVRWAWSAWVGAPGVLANQTGAATVTYSGYRVFQNNTWHSAHWSFTSRDSIGTITVNAGDIVHMEVYRDGAHGDDTLTGEAALFMVELEYTADS